MNNKITIEQATKQISEGFSSIYSKDDVLHLLSVLETSDSFTITDEMVKDLSSDIAESLENEGTDIVDDYTLSMNYKEVELDSIDLNVSKIQSAVQDALETYIDNNCINFFLDVLKYDRNFVYLNSGVNDLNDNIKLCNSSYILLDVCINTSPK